MKAFFVNGVTYMLLEKNGLFAIMIGSKVIAKNIPSERDAINYINEIAAADDEQMEEED